MSVSLNGSSQYVSLGNGVNILSTLPITLAAVVQSASLPSGLRGFFSQGHYTNNRGWGGFAFAGPPKKMGGYGANFGSTTELDGTIDMITADHGWYLCLTTFRDNGGAFEASASAYSYTDVAWVATDTIVVGFTNGTFNAPDVGDEAMIGALNINGTAVSFWPTDYSWIAIFDQDYGTNPSANANAIELVANGAWNLLNSHCKLFIPFTNAATDQSGNGHNGSLIGSPSYSTAGPGELAPSGGGAHIWVNATGGIQTLTGGIYG